MIGFSSNTIHNPLVSDLRNREVVVRNPHIWKKKGENIAQRRKKNFLYSSEGGKLCKQRTHMVVVQNVRRERGEKNKAALDVYGLIKAIKMCYVSILIRAAAFHPLPSLSLLACAIAI